MLVKGLVEKVRLLCGMEQLLLTYFFHVVGETVLNHYNIFAHFQCRILFFFKDFDSLVDSTKVLCPAKSPNDRQY